MYHVSARGVDGQPIFRDDEDRAGYMLMLAATVKRFNWRLLMYCQMGTHVHLLIETPDANLADGMRWFHGHYGRCFNKQHRRRGHLFQGRFHAEPILTEAHLVSAVGYIAVNPVVAGICRDPREWRWGSHARVTADRAPEWLAHEHLLARLDAIGSDGAYERLITVRLGAY